MAGKYNHIFLIRLSNFSINRFSVKPCEDDFDPVISHIENDNYLRETLESTLQLDNVCYQILLQPQNDACINPIEDPTVMWHGDYIKIGTSENTPTENFSDIF